MLALRCLIEALKRWLRDALLRPSLRLILRLWSLIHRFVSKRHPQGHDITPRPQREFETFEEPEVIRVHPSCTPYQYSFTVPNASMSSQDITAVRIQTLETDPMPPPPPTPYPTEISEDVANDEPNGFLVESPAPGISADDRLPGRTDSPDQYGGGDLPELNARHSCFTPMTPDHASDGRYDRKSTIEDEPRRYIIQPLTCAFDGLRERPGWTAFTHPEGACFYLHKERRIYTDASITQDHVYDHLVDFIEKLDDFLRIRNIALDDDVDIVLDIDLSCEMDAQTEKLDSAICKYYLVSHKNRSIFWLDKFDAELFDLWQEVNGVTEPSHIKHLVESLYWYHCYLYPTARPTTSDCVDELRDILIHGIMDTSTSTTSTAPYNTNELQQFLSLTNNMKKRPDAGLGTTSALCRLMYIFVQQRFYNFYGQPCARLDREYSVYGHPKIPHRSIPLMIISPFLFNGPEINLRALQRMWVDRVLHVNSWMHFITKLNTEWQEFILFGTVLLTANVGFLAIQSVDESVEEPLRSPAQMASYVSVVTSLGCIIIGLLLIRHNRTKTRETAQDASNFLAFHNNPSRGLETLAVLYSLPYALLMWGMVSFLAAFFLMIYINSTLTVRLVVGVAWFAVAFLIAWCIFINWDRQKTFFDMWHYIGACVRATVTERPKELFAHPANPLSRLFGETKEMRKESYDSDQTVTV